MNRCVWTVVLVCAGAAAVLAVGGEDFALEPGLASRSDIVGFWGFEVSSPYGSFCSSDTTAWRTDIYGAWWSPNCERNGLVSGADALSGISRSVQYPAGTFGPADNGDNWPISFDRVANMPVKRYDSLYLRYYVRFSDDFDFQMGGKLPGLVGGNNWSRSGGDQPDGTDGWTTRYMFGGGGFIFLYAYLPPAENPDIMTSGYGSHELFGLENGGVSRAAHRGRWHCLEQFVRINDVGLANGQIRCWMDGELSLQLDDVVFRTVANGENQVGAFYFSTFHGGSSMDWAPDTTGFVYYDNIVVAEEYIGPIEGTPTVSIDNDIDGDTLTQGEFLTLTATASSNAASVEFFLNGNAVGADSSAPFEHRLYLTPGDYVLRARAVSDRLLVGGSQAVSYVVVPGPAPTPDTVLSAVDDAYVRGGAYEDENHGTEGILVVKTEGNEEMTRDAHIKFDLSAVGAIAGARLKLYCTGTDRTVVPTVYAAADNGWQEETVTWATAPARGDALVSVSVPSGDQWYEFDITEHVSALPASTATLSLVVRDISLAGGWTTYASSESGSQGPVLELVEGTPVAGPSVGRRPAEAFAVSWSVDDSRVLVVNAPAGATCDVRDLSGRAVVGRRATDGTARMPLPGPASRVFVLSVTWGQRTISSLVTSTGAPAGM